MTVTSSALKTLKPLIKAFDVNTYRAPSLAQQRAAHIGQAKSEEFFTVYDGRGFFPSIRKIDMPPLVLNAEGKEWVSFGIRSAHYLRNSVKAGDRVVFSEGSDRLYLIYDHRFFLDTLQPQPLLRAVALGDRAYAGGFGFKGLYKGEWGSEQLAVPEKTPARLVR